MLKIVLEKGLSNVLVVVTRYFGGILLGTGGLVRAYSEATIKALEKAKIVNKKKGYKVKIVTAYDQIEQFNYYVNKNKLKVINTEYLENIEFMVEMAEEQLNEITNNNSKNPLKIIKYDILKEKYIDI
ncbi:MAG TPA: YigZ family protein [Clostridiaceae bacterium]|nr:YigZ family protein [Clostridiaceae bacterium]